MPRNAYAVLGVVLIVLFSLVWAGLETAGRTQGVEEPDPAPDQEPPVFTMPPSGPFAPESISIPNARAIAAWSRSGHADASAEAFAHWNDEGAIPPVCATCHSGIGFRAFHGLDGSPAGPAAEPVPVGGVVDCETCHNPGLAGISEVALPTGARHPVTGGEASCVTCHQGRASGADVAAAVDGIGEDTPDSTLRFVNPHYKIAAASSLGGYGHLGYEYEGKTYSGRFGHARPVATCVSCHDPHSLAVPKNICLTCHETGDPDAIRITRQSYDGSGNTSQGIARDIAANADLLMALIQDYAGEVAGKPLVYDGARHPYFFADANADGRPDEKEGRPVAYDAFTPRLLKAIYNWKFVQADPGIHVHNPPYALELLYDSAEDLAGVLGNAMSEYGTLR